MDPMAAKFLGAGLACIGMGTAAIGVANVFGQFLLRGVAQSVGGGRPDDDAVSRLRAGRGVRHLLAADRDAPPVRALRLARTHGRRSARLTAGVADGREEGRTDRCAHRGNRAGKKAPFPPFDKTTFASQLVWLAITFVILYLLISRVAIPRIGGILAARTQRIEGDFAAAQRMKEKSEAALAAYEKSLTEARNRAHAIGTEIRDKLHAEGEERRKAIEAKLNAQLAEAEQTIATTKTAAMANVRSIAVDAAAAIVERLIGTVPPAPAVAAAVDEALKR